MCVFIVFPKGKELTSLKSASISVVVFESRLEFISRKKISVLYLSVFVAELVHRLLLTKSVACSWLSALSTHNDLT